MECVQTYRKNEGECIRKDINISRNLIISISLILLSYIALSAQPWKIYPYHKEGTLIYFPQDEGSHSEFNPGSGTEWWYVNMHLEGEITKRKYSAMVAFFNYNFRIFNITDDTNHEFLSFMDFGTLVASDTNLNLHFTLSEDRTDRWFTQENLEGEILPFQYHVEVGDESNNLKIDLDAQKPPLIVGGDGLVTVGSGNSYYYSQTHLTVTGSLTFKDYPEPVSGKAWIDHQYGPFFLVPGGDESYEWFSVQLDNQMDIIMWNIFTKENKIPNDDSHRMCTLFIDNQTQDTTSALSLTRRFFWEYDDGRFFSSGWRFIDPIHNIELDIIPNFRNQTVPFVLAPFWEGSCSVEGLVNGDSVKGQGFAELLHIYKNPKIKVISPNGGDMWDGSQPITWKIENPDDGNPLHYDIYYKQGVDGFQRQIISALSDTSYLWDVSNLLGMDSCLILIVGYSIDSTIIGVDTSDAIFSIVPPVSLGNIDGLKLIEYELFQNYPNPFNPSTKIEFNLPKTTNVKIEIYNTTGQKIETLLNEKMATGIHQLEFNAQNLSSGVYFYRIETGEFRDVKKMILLK
jgi:predicted secreted hydrolase